MESVFLGTGAAELYPNPFADTEFTRERLAIGETRLRSAFLLDEELLIDFGPDVPAAAQHYHVPLYKVKDVLITHTHQDHFSMGTMDILNMTKPPRPITFHLSEEALNYVMAVEKAMAPLGGTPVTNLLTKELVRFEVIRPFEPQQIGCKTVTALKTNHQGSTPEERAQNYLIDWERGRWLYACDTGVYGEEDLAFLKKNCGENGPIQTVIIEGTFGSCHRDPVTGAHMTCENLCIQIDNLRAVGAIDDDTQVYITHINVVQEFTQAQYQRWMDRHADAHVTVAQDGDRI